MCTCISVSNNKYDICLDREYFKIIKNTNYKNVLPTIPIIIAVKLHVQA